MKAFTPNVLEALTEALTKIYWYKKDLRSFLYRAGVPEAVINSADWGSYKRHVAQHIVDHLAADPASGTGLISRIIDAVVEQDSFDHLHRLDDGRLKAEEAEAAARRLKDLFGRQSVAERAARARREKRTEAERIRQEAKTREHLMTELRDEFEGLARQDNPQNRGLKFERFLRRLFAAHDLNPRGGFASSGEQIDGSIELDGTLYLVEAKWTVGQTTPAKIRDFRGKVEEKLDNTLGFFISMNGFTEEAVNRAARGRRVLILVDGRDLSPVLQGIIDLVELLRRKIRRAAETGEVLYRVSSS